MKDKLWLSFGSIVLVLQTMRAVPTLGKSLEWGLPDGAVF